MATMSASPDRSLVQQHDAIKSEFPDEQVIVNHTRGEVINLDSDDEGDLMPAPPAPRRAPQSSVAPSEDGLFVSESTPAPPTSVERTREVQAKFAAEMRLRIATKKALETTNSDAAASGRDDASETSAIARKRSDEESKAFARLKAAHTRKKNAGTLTIEQEVEYMKADAAEQQRLRKAITDEGWERGGSEEEVAISEAVMDDFVAPRPDDGTSDDDDVPETPVKGRSKKRTAGDTGPAPKRARKTTAAKATAKVDARKKKTPAAKGKASKAKAGQRMTNMSSIMGTDMFGDVTATVNLRNQPTVGANVPRVRDKALTQLIASVPIEDKKEAGADKKLLMRAIQDFDGKYSVKASAEGDGNWNVVGMKSSLKHYQACMPSTHVEDNQPTSFGAVANCLRPGLPDGNSCCRPGSSRSPRRSQNDPGRLPPGSGCVRRHDLYSLPL
ncbi:hypothetical protein LTR56_027837 [Elasticomyces elasticus]|nr:hypothetical protein LTR56_027837 [Elasticomyces elasticus]KAK3615386.1 hypothetical protein LTR22_027455 [Elasticomyces elasticus]KAK4897038.1 hypothetical protein LTR49_028068 [Elasticomyces elasticus]